MSETKLKAKGVSAERAAYRQEIKNRFLKYGLSSFSEKEVLELLLLYAIPLADTEKAAEELLKKSGSFLGAFEISCEEMKSVDGIKDQAATLLKVVPELVRYYSALEAFTLKNKVTTREDLAQVCVKCLTAQAKEVLLCLFLNGENRLIDIEYLSKGNHNSVTVNARDIINKANNLHSDTVILAHNHPTFDLTPSVEDAMSTDKLKKLLNEVNIDLAEHFIVCADKWLGIIHYTEENIGQSFFGRPLKDNLPK